MSNFLMKSILYYFFGSVKLTVFLLGIQEKLHCNDTCSMTTMRKSKFIAGPSRSYRENSLLNEPNNHYQLHPCICPLPVNGNNSPGPFDWNESLIQEEGWLIVSLQQWVD